MLCLVQHSGSRDYWMIITSISSCHHCIHTVYCIHIRYTYCLHTCLLSIVTSFSFHPLQVCLTPECVSVAAEIIESADMSVDPCTDFYQVNFNGCLFMEADIKFYKQTLSVQNETLDSGRPSVHVFTCIIFPGLDGWLHHTFLFVIFDLISSVCLWWLAEEQPNPKW
jgi:hypothetical protein